MVPRLIERLLSGSHARFERGCPDPRSYAVIGGFDNPTIVIYDVGE
jgi:hypothetical protein